MEVRVTEDVNVKVVLLNGEEEVAKATCFINNTPEMDGKRIGTIGEFDVKDYTV